MRMSTLLIICVLLLTVNLAYAELEIIVKSSPNWGKISTRDVKKLCENITSHFEQHLREENEINDTVNLYRTFRAMSYATLEQNADVKYKIGIVLKKNMEIRADDFYYFIFDFAHEFCHILHQFEITTIENPNLWFQESIACMASIWTLRSMAKTWKHDSPFGTFATQDGGIAYFSQNFSHYADAYLKNSPEHQYNGTGKEWLKEHEMLLREQYYKTGAFIQHHLVSQLSYKFLPIFEKYPEAWNAVRKMPATKGKISQYMQDWYDAVDAQDKQYVEAIATEMGITITSPAITSTNLDADINNDGYIDLSDVMIVRSAMQNSVSYDTDINNDGITDEVDLLIVKAKATEAIAAAAPSLRRKKVVIWATLKRK